MGVTKIDGEQNWFCAICREEKELEDKITTACKHIFHSMCLQEALSHSRKCPLCRTVFPDDYLLTPSQALFLAVRDGKIHQVRDFINEGVSIREYYRDPTIGDLKGDTLLHIAVFYGHLDVAELLIDNGIPVDAKSHFGDTALLLAIIKKHDRIKEMLIRRGADMGIIKERYRGLGSDEDSDTFELIMFLSVLMDRYGRDGLPLDSGICHIL